MYLPAGAFSTSCLAISWQAIPSQVLPRPWSTTSIRSPKPALKSALINARDGEKTFAFSYTHYSWLWSITAALKRS